MRELIPEILSHPHIPKPLHGLNPRTLKGQIWWDKTRFKAQKDWDYRCAACGASKNTLKGKSWLEGHERWDIDYKTGVCKVLEIIPLCHYCHNFIHSGRLMFGSNKRINEIIEILEHGFDILRESGNPAFYITKLIAKDIGAYCIGVDTWEPPDTTVKWGEWKLILDGTEYRSKFKNEKEWKKYYNRR